MFNLNESLNHQILYVQIYEQLKEMIKKGTYKANQKLPSKRKLSVLLKVSPLTVDRSYQQLIAEGYVYSIEKSGYFVAEQVEMQIIDSNKFKDIEMKEEKKTEYLYQFKTNIVDTSIFPNATWAKLAREVLSENHHEMLNESHPKGMRLLRVEIAKFLELYRGMKVDLEQIIIGSGSTSLISMIVEMLGRDQKYAIEDPSYQKIYQLFKSNDVDLSPIQLDLFGIEMKSLKKSLASIVHITPSHQFPTGIVMPIQRRTELLNWASESENRYIIEDDYDSEFRYLGKPIPALQSLDQNDRIIYMNTFTKTLAPSFRMSYMVLPKKLLPIYSKIQSYHSCTVPNFEQYIMYKFMKGGYFERHINRMKNLYKQKIEMIIESCSHYKDIEIKGIDAGLHCLLVIHQNIDEKEFLVKMNEKQIFIKGLHEYYVNEETLDKPTLVLGYSGIPLGKLKESLDFLLKAIFENK